MVLYLITLLKLLITVINAAVSWSDSTLLIPPATNCVDLPGSMTLRHWQHLATPHLGGIFEERDGVQIKGEKKLDLVEEIYSLSDFEEDGRLCGVRSGTM